MFSMMSKHPFQIFSQRINASLRMKVSVWIILPTVLMLSIFTLAEYIHFRAVLLKNLAMMASTNGQLLIDAMETSLQTSDFADIQRTFDLVGKNKNYRVLYLLDPTGKVILAPNSQNIGSQLDNSNPSCMPCHSLPVGQRPSGIVIKTDDGKEVFRSMQPIANSPACTGCHDSKKAVLGVLLADISVAQYGKFFITDLRTNLLLGLGSMIVSVVIVNLAMSRLVLRRLEKVAEALANFGHGKRDLQLASTGRDEIGCLENDFNAMEQQIQEKEAANTHLSEVLQQKTEQQQELLKRLISAQEDERNRVARELHDELGQALSSLALHTQVIKRWVKDDPERALHQLAISREVIDKTTDQMHELIMALHPSILDDLGLVAALHAHGKRLFEDSNIKFSLETSGMHERLPPFIETALYRTFQEALSNIIKHSKADQVKISLIRQDGTIEGEVCDNGSGFIPGSFHQDGTHLGGMGLLGMRERISQCDGNLEVVSVPGQGTCIKIRIPLNGGTHE